MTEADQMKDAVRRTEAALLALAAAHADYVTAYDEFIHRLASDPVGPDDRRERDRRDTRQQSMESAVGPYRLTRALAARLCALGLEHLPNEWGGRLPASWANDWCQLLDVKVR